MKLLPRYRDPNNNADKAVCADSPENSIDVTLPASQVPQNLVISLNHGEAIYDGCNPAEDTHGYFTTYLSNSTTMTVHVRLQIGTPLRTSYFGADNDTTHPPLRSDLSLVIAQRPTCESAGSTLLSRDGAGIQWMLQKGSHAGCTNDWTAVAGKVAF